MGVSSRGRKTFSCGGVLVGVLGALLVIQLGSERGRAQAPSIAFVQQNYATPQTPQTVVMASYPAAQTAGNLNVVIVGWNDSTVQLQSVSDTKGNVYQKAVGPTIQAGLATQSIYYSANIAAAAANGNAVTVTFTAPARYPDIRVAEYRGLDPANPLDVVAAAQGSSTSSNSGTVATTNANDLLVGANLVQTGTSGPGSGFTSRVITDPDGDILEDRIVTSAGNYSAAAAISSGAWVMQMAAFRAAAGGGGGGGAAPSITNLTPSSGPVGTSATITGANFGATQGTSTVTFNGTTATPTSWNATSIVAPVPSGATTGNVVVTVAGLASNGASFTVTSVPAPPPLTFVQLNYSAPQSPQTVVTVPYPAAQTAGHLNVVIAGWNDSTVQLVSVTDSKGNPYQRAVGPTTQAGLATQSIYYATGIAAAAANTNAVTVTFTGPATYADIRAAEYSGVDPANPVDVTAAAQGSGTMSNSGSAVTTNGNDLLVGANVVQTVTSAAGAGFTNRVITSPNGDILEDRIVSVPGSYSATAPLSSGAWIMQMVAFRALSGGSADTQPPTAPANLTATAVSGSQIGLSWTASTDNVGVTGYLVERCAGVGCTTFAQAATIPPGATFTDTGLTASTSYSYRLRAVDAAGNRSAYSNVASAATAFIVLPGVTTLTFTRTEQFISTGGNVTWFVDAIPGGSAASGTITATGLYAPPASVGTHIVSASNESTSANATVYVVNYPGTFTRDIDKLRTGLNANETVLTPANVNETQFGKLFSYPIDGVSDATPLYVANVNVAGQGFHNVAYVATEHDSVYAFDADGLTPAPLWHVSFINPAAGITTIPAADTDPTTNCCDLEPEVGVTSTPVIDPLTATIYVVAATKEVVGSTTTYFEKVHALDIASGTEKLGGPITIQASVTGTGDGAVGGRLSLDPRRQGQRPALLLSNGVVYIAFGGHDDYPPYHGWILGYDAATLRQVMVYNTTPDGAGGGIWQSGDGLATDQTGRIYFVTGNGTFNASSGGRNYGDSFEAINTNGAPSDYFTPHDQATMSINDLDLGSGGVLLLPDQSGPHPHLAVSGGKNGTIYLVDRDNMGHYRSKNDNQIVQVLVNRFPGGTFGTGNFKAPVYFNSNLYFSADADTIKVFTISNGLLSTSPTSQTSVVLGYPGATLSLSANGASSAILWAVERLDLDQSGNGAPAPGVLHAFDARNVAIELYNSNQAAGVRDALDFAAKWASPVVANGKVFVASNGRLTIFGLLP